MRLVSDRCRTAANANFYRVETAVGGGANLRVDWSVSAIVKSIFSGRAIREFYQTIFEIVSNSFIYVGNDVEYLKTFSDRYFDWVYIYSSHEYDHTKDELEVLNNKIKENGIICGHDWHNDETHIHYGVTKAVVKFCDSYNWKLIYVNKHMQWR